MSSLRQRVGCAGVRESRWAVVTIVAALAVGACGSNESESTDSGSTETAVPQPSTATAAGPAAGATTLGSAAATTRDTGGVTTLENTTLVPDSLQFSVPLVGGGQLDGESLVGKPVAFWFWAPT